MDKIFIKDFEIFANHGVFNEEKNLGQKFILSIEFGMDLRKAGVTGDLKETVNYGELCLKIEKEFTKEKYDLIETAAEKIAEFILLEYERVKSVKLLLKKPWAPIGKHVEYAAVEIERAWHTVYVGMGSNMGDKEENLKAAIKLIEDSSKSKVTKISKFYITKPVGYLDQDDFLNCAIEVKTILSPEEFMTALLNFEKILKRERIIHWGPRTIDLDILLYDNLVTSEEDYIIPHPRMPERLFVIEPLCDIAPYLVHPILNKRIIDIKAELSKTRL
ncbi:2-amino-4-hydroxy-6-hydroxymethyldihydropteridine diphosphokinase [Clostridium pasteurianum]|uniref:Bifunctional folate synthesis protein n=1 Tax=Clostridium pasteurianum BC1 TaxID=86416 RepID=R4JYI1_CLOPA|nr:2-amino-4-hydroxy-6-hydroxymethyldihydropteridine diphosphokinase [Clostridium pasteurianum]AGK95353.1 dihydroneopterin aldolase/2-amino-4-hydroxy-6-hydroxymethyldihydropteridine pyrophosphokinase [Clostridium pasteurianum BC1]